ncbi:MAG TPA: LD-carboxypeptidase [Bacteroidales bacterium]|nr:LD-carboxypeptidase [Bacteroidales bacterium]HPA12786.1 LD-carboxypeptidase [Bacteroidales bacterium]HQO06448.1 LD-carboxypeptidase [Bacteroidales bacterium]HQP53691.1 LD-carboxypeptidase [Bacteroidales bacterium]
MITPSNLHKGDLIGLISPSAKIDPSILYSATRLLEAKGYRVKQGEYALSQHYYFAGTDSQRAHDFQLMLDDPSIKMIICNRGGYGMVKIIDRLDFSCFLDNPKWIAGYSDITVLHCHLAMLYKTKSIHSIMPYDFPADGNSCLAIDKLLEVAGGKKPTYNLPTHDLNLEGSANGMLVGGNISILTSLLGSQSELDTEGSILFLEEVGEPLYRLDRMMQTLKRSGKLSSLAGLIVGGMTKMNEEQEDYGLSAEEVIMDMISDVNYPVCFGFPAGHFPENHPLIIGGEVSLSVNKNSVKIIFK